MFSIESVMSKELITALPSESLADARARMQAHQIHHLPIVDDDGQLVGLITLTNLLAATDSILRDQENRIHADEILIEDVMITDLATIDEQAGLRQAALFLEKHHIGCLPVVTNGELKGIITDTDFVAIAINLLEQVEDSEPVEEQYA
jgi:CBS domain-containing membrane protein